MLEVEYISLLVQTFCGISAILFMFVATFSRSEKAELLVQNIIFTTLLLAAASCGGFRLQEVRCGGRTTSHAHFPLSALSWQLQPV